jgi:hypothetical protein
MLEAKEFLSAMVPTLPEDERIILCAFPGDPNDAPPTAWKPKPWCPNFKLNIPRDWNGYVTVASFFQAQDGSWRRRKSLFAGGHALMVDDIGTGKGAKIQPTMIKLPPSAIIETSPANYQWWYFLDEPDRDAVHFDAVIRAFIHGQLLGMDPGMAGITRVGRLPGFFNGKRAYGGFTTRMTTLSYVNYSAEELIEHFGLELRGRNIPIPPVSTEEHIRRSNAYVGVYNFLQARGMLKKPEPDLSGWTEMTCPWVDGHTGGVDNGAAICEPDNNNAYHGGFRCHHGHCLNRGWRDLSEWVNELATDELAQCNARGLNLDDFCEGGQQ